MSPIPPSTSPGRAPFLRLFLLAAGIVALFLAGRYLGGYLQEFAAWIEKLGPWGPAGLIAGYVLGTIALVPGSAITLATGALFGLLEGTIYVFIGATLGSIAAFLIARYLARGWIEGRIAKDERFTAIDRAVGKQGLKITFLLRLSPAVPFNFLNYALGLTRVTLRDYMVSSVGMIPGTILYVYYGKVAGDLAALASSAKIQKGPEYYGLLAVGLLATLAVTLYVTKLAKKALEEATDVGR
ncbi:MAG: TVP38/TMEM64 family protein [Bdellovibrionota bacterium]